MPQHNPDCVHGAAHAYSACRDRYNTPLKMVPDPEPASNEAVAEAAVQTGDAALTLLLAAAGNAVTAGGKI